jgi:transcriptional regulator with PAS, ATPase and Fis domain
MHGMEPHACADSDTVVPPVLAWTTSQAPNSSLTVLLCDYRPERSQVISSIISECGACARWIKEVSAIPQCVSACDCNLAIIALGAYPSLSDLDLENIRSLKRQGFRVICHEEGLHFWPLGIRCQILLAGSSWLLDSAKEDFSQELRRLLAQFLQAESGRRDEESRIKQAMSRLGSVGESQAIMAIFRRVLRVSPLSDVPVLITGETGTGKELLAHAIHQLDLKRCHGPFIALNCSALSLGLAESELFGHRRGAFTGADRDRKGLIRAAEGGILFLDEIGELDDAIQAKLLRVLQENRVLGIGEDQEVAVSVRVVAATNRNLDAMMHQRTFRADLFHRLNVLAIHIPPLRERPADLKPLTEHFLEKYQNLKPSSSLAMDPEFMDALTQLQWLGNTRQLENMVRWVLVNKDDETPLNLSDLPLEIWQQLADQRRHPEPSAGPADAGEAPKDATVELPREDIISSLVNLLNINGWNLSRSLEYFERLLLEAALHKTQGNQSQTAHLLGITPRSIYNKIHKYQLRH